LPAAYAEAAHEPDFAYQDGVDSKKLEVPSCAQSFQDGFFDGAGRQAVPDTGHVGVQSGQLVEQGVV
jgi:hypothetical protein